ncbi:MAG: GcrA family cell cycle regulator [Pseudomonadota bacterium]
MSWTDERVELLTKLWSEGLSASQIATELGGVTRNAVIGKVHRLGLSGRGKAPAQAKPRRTVRQSRAPRRTVVQSTVGNTALKQVVEEDVEPMTLPQVRTATVTSIVIPLEQRRSILTLNEQTCKWPVGDPGTDEFYFCGAQCDVGSPYCEAHAKVAYQPAERRRDRKAKSS